ncbi:MAG: hypothetical protein HFG41_08065 [Coprococcus sp.]|nr:hypothetical protein [Coprococcus sp.]
MKKKVISGVLCFMMVMVMVFTGCDDSMDAESKDSKDKEGITIGMVTSQGSYFSRALKIPYVL